MNETFMKEKPVFPLLMSLSLPMVISMLVNALYNIVDSFFVAKISEDAMTALSLVFPLQNFVNSVAVGFGVGISAVIAIHLGEGEQERADRAATHGFVLSIVHGLLLMVVCIAIMPTFLRMFTSSETVVDLGVRYSTIVFSFATVITASLSMEKIFQAVGRMKVTMLSLMVGCLTNICLDPVLIFGLGPFPAMGIEGAAFATGIGQVLTVVIYVVIYFYRPIPVRLSRKSMTADRNLDKKLYAVGIPATLNMALPSLLISALNAILVGYSQIYVVILGIYYKLQTFLYMPANGIVQGMRPIIGYNYGAGEHKRVEKIYRLTLTLSGAIMLLGTLICLAGTADCHLHRESGNHSGRRQSAAHHQRRIYRFRGIGDRIWRSGRSGKRLSFLCHFPVSVCGDYYSSGLSFQPDLGTGWRVECFLDC